MADEPAGRQASSGDRSPNVNQQGRVNIAQIGYNNQATVVDRHRLALDERQQTALANSLAAFSGRKIKFHLEDPVPEVHKFAAALASALARAGIEVTDISEWMSGGGTPPGISFFIPKGNQDAMRLASELVNALMRVQAIPHETVPAAEGNNDLLILRVRAY